MPHAINASLYRKPPYDPERDFTAVSQITMTGMVVDMLGVQAAVALAPRLPHRP